MYKSLKIFLISYLLLINASHADVLDQNSINQFIENMVASYQYDADKLHSLFSQVKLSQRVLEAISRPAEKLPWYEYRTLFLQPDRIEQGLIFWERYQTALKRADQLYGVPAHIIVAIIGVETRYGQSTGKDRVMDALVTLAFHYPERSDFFRNELEEYLLLTREQGIDPLSIKGSYAGAMGIPQFIPSSYRRYAIDFDDDGKIDIWNNPVDAIGSVANYFNQYGWEMGEMIAVPAEIQSNQYVEILNDDPEPHIRADELKKYGINQPEYVPPEALLKLLRLDTSEGEEIWLGLNNFYVITRYNHSVLYAMAVYQLSDEILRRYENKVAIFK